MIAAVLCYNQPDLTRAMFNQLGSEMLVIDNGSTVRQPALGCSMLRLPVNKYFSGGWNLAMSRLRDHDYVWMLNSDVEGVSMSMMYALAEIAKRLDLATISPAFNSPHSHMHRQGTGTRMVKWLDWCCPLVSMQAWRDVGEFDYPAFLGYGADLDWCKRAEERGYRFAVSDDHEITHLGSVTALSEGLQSAQGNVEQMNQALREKWNVSSWTEMF